MDHTAKVSVSSRETEAARKNAEPDADGFEVTPVTWKLHPLPEAEQELHSRTHVPYRLWCIVCLAERPSDLRPQS